MLRANCLEHHVADFDAEVDFFRNMVGCRENMFVPNSLAAFQIADNFVLLVLPRDPSHPDYGTFKGATIDISVDLPDVDKRYEELKAKGAEIRQPPITQPFGIRTFYFESPGGVTIEYEAATNDDGKQLLKQAFGES